MNDLQTIEREMKQLANCKTGALATTESIAKLAHAMAVLVAEVQALKQPEAQ